MGVVDRFLAKGGTPTSVNIYAGTRPLVQLKFEASWTKTGRAAFGPKAIVIPQNETEKILGNLLDERGGRVEWNTEFVDFKQDTTRVVSRLHVNDAEQQVASDWLVSCEGAHSLIREQAGINFTGKTYRLSFFLADVELDGPLTHAENYVWMHKDGSFAALPVPTPRTWRLIVDVSRKPPSRGHLTRADP